MLTPEKSWYQNNPGVSKIPVSAKFWCQKSSGASKVLVSAKSWYQKNALKGSRLAQV
jgi:hypothetical protein